MIQNQALTLSKLSDIHIYFTNIYTFIIYLCFYIFNVKSLNMKGK